MVLELDALRDGEGEHDPVFLEERALYLGVVAVGHFGLELIHLLLHGVEIDLDPQLLLEDEHELLEGPLVDVLDRDEVLHHEEDHRRPTRQGREVLDHLLYDLLGLLRRLLPLHDAPVDLLSRLQHQNQLVVVLHY